MILIYSVLLTTQPLFISQNQMVSELFSVTEWLETNKLSLSISMPKYVIFHTYIKEIIDLNPVVRMNGIAIERVHISNFFGFTLYEYRTWKSH